MHLGLALRLLSLVRAAETASRGEGRSISAVLPHGWVGVSSQKDLHGDAAKGSVLCVCLASRSHRELGSSAAAVGQQQQAPQTQPREWVAPQQRWRTSKHRLHAVPPQATLPRGLLVFETFDFLRGIGFTVTGRSVYGMYGFSKVMVLRQTLTDCLCLTEFASLMLTLNIVFQYYQHEINISPLFNQNKPVKIKISVTPETLPV